MSGAAGAAGAAAAASAAMAAVARRRRQQEEEEELATYDREDLDGWEFKILRSASSKFKRREYLEGVLEEEARAGWELLEKFDDERIRLKRRVVCRARGSLSEIDPYRAWVGTTPSQIGLRVLLGVLVFVGVILALVAMFGR